MISWTRHLFFLEKLCFRVLKKLPKITFEQLSVGSSDCCSCYCQFIQVAKGSEFSHAYSLYSISKRIDFFLIINL